MEQDESVIPDVEFHPARRFIEFRKVMQVHLFFERRVVRVGGDINLLQVAT